MWAKSSKGVLNQHFKFTCFSFYHALTNLKFAWMQHIKLDTNLVDASWAVEENSWGADTNLNALRVYDDWKLILVHYVKSLFIEIVSRVSTENWEIGEDNIFEDAINVVDNRFPWMDSYLIPEEVLSWVRIKSRWFASSMFAQHIITRYIEYP